MQMEMDIQTQKRVEEVVVEMLKAIDLEATTRRMIRSMVEKALDIDLSVPVRKLFVKQVIDTFCEQVEREKDEQEEEKCDKVVNTFCEQVEREKTTRDYKEEEEDEEEEEEEEEDEEEEEEQARKNAADDNEMRKKKRKTVMESAVGGGGGDEEIKDILICKLSKTRMVTVRKYNGVRYVCIRNYILRGEKLLPTEKGVNMKVKQWEALCNASPEIEKALKKLEDNSQRVVPVLGVKEGSGRTFRRRRR